MKTQDIHLQGKAGVLQVMKLKDKLCLQLLYFMLDTHDLFNQITRFISVFYNYISHPVLYR